MNEKMSPALGGSGKTGKQTNDVMLSSEVVRYRLLREKEYQALYVAQDLRALIYAMSERQLWLFHADCVEHALRHMRQYGHPLARKALKVEEQVRLYANGDISLKTLIAERAVYLAAFKAAYPTPTYFTYDESYQTRMAYTEVVRLAYVMNKQRYFELGYVLPQPWQLDRAMYYLMEVGG